MAYTLFPKTKGEIIKNCLKSPEKAADIVDLFGCLKNKFKDIEAFEKIIVAIDRDIRDLAECKQRVNKLKSEHNYPNTSEHLKRIVDLYNEMVQWKTLFERFPDWINENGALPIHPRGTICTTIKKLFK